MKEELVAADYGSLNQVMRWKEDKVRATYKSLEKLRKTDPTAPQKPDYPKAEVSKKTIKAANQEIHCSSWCSHL